MPKITKAKTKKPFSVALIGGDGAGKTTIGKCLEQTSSYKMKYLYMGMSIQSSTTSLPTTRLFYLLRLWIFRRECRRKGLAIPDKIPSYILEYGQTRRGTLWKIARFVNRLLEACYRNLISSWFKKQGYIVIYDRHFLFDSAPGVKDFQVLNQTVLDSLFFWLMKTFFPKPDLVLFLDVPPELLFLRKGDTSVENLSLRRQGTLRLADTTPNFICIDASQPFEKVLAEVTNQIEVYYSLRNLRNK